MMNITISNLYDSDYQLWLESTINQLRRGDFQAVGTFRKQIKKILRDSPSLKPYLSEILEECYTDAREITG